MTVLTFNTLPLGYRFRPTDEELVDYYLRNKINGNDNDVKVIREIDVCKWEPWDLPGLSVVQSNDLEWYFFCPRDQKYPNGPRLNRATEAGYWKATGKDRKIKNRVSEIGTKKTLVFYRGRAPKGKRSNWVMHEYRPTLPELDGTHPGQNAFVLCRLFKKLDESVESPHSDEVEPTLSSPTATNSSPGYIQSELALEQEKQALELQNEKQPTISESCQGKDLEKISGSILTPLECHNHNDNAYDADDHAAAVAATEVDPPQVEYSDWLSDLIVDPEDCIPFSPLSTQMRAELGSSDMHYPVPNEFSNDRSGLQFQCDTNEQDAHISELLNSILIESKDDYYFGDPGTQKTLTAENKTPKYISTISHYKDSVKDGRSCSELDPESAQAQLDTGIRLRNRQPEDYSSSTYFMSLQGSTHRRVRMQTKLEIGILNSRETDLGFGAEGTKGTSTVTEVEKPAESHAADAASATTVDELQMVTLSTGRAQWSKGMSRGIVPQYRDGNDASMFAKTGGVHGRSFWSPMSMLRRVGVVMVFCAVLVGLRRCIEY